jgi:hypothetical protein
VLTGSKAGSITIPLLATSPAGSTIAVGTHPALVSNEHAKQTHDLRDDDRHQTLVLQDYVVEHDLPAAYQFIARSVNQKPGPERTSRTGREGREVDLPIFEITDLADGKNKAAKKLRVRVQNFEQDYFAVRVSVAELSRLGMPQGAVVVLRQSTLDDCAGGTLLLVSRTSGTFRLTGKSWTIAQVKQLSDDGGERMQISYARPEAEFRPERLRKDELRVLGAIVEVVQAGRR